MRGSHERVYWRLGNCTCPNTKLLNEYAMAPTIAATAEQPMHEKNAYENHPQRSVWKKAKNVTR